MPGKAAANKKTPLGADLVEDMKLESTHQQKTRIVRSGIGRTSTRLGPHAVT